MRLSLNKNKTKTKKTYKKSKRNQVDKIVKISDNYQGKYFVWILEHMMRLDSENLNWRKRNKYFIDSPLSPNGREQAQKSGDLISKQIKEERLSNSIEIYSSPYRRCLETSLEIARQIEKNLKIKVLIKVEYLLAEDNDKVNIYDKLIKIRGHLQLKREKLDDYLFPNLRTTKPLKDWIDHNYQSIFKPNKMLSYEPYIEGLNRSYKFLKYLEKGSLEKGDNKNIIVVTHPRQFRTLYNLSTNQKNYNIIGGNYQDVGMMTRLEKKKVNDKIVWKIDQEPKKNIMDV